MLFRRSLEQWQGYCEKVRGALGGGQQYEQVVVRHLVRKAMWSGVGLLNLYQWLLYCNNNEQTHALKIETLFFPPIKDQ